MHSALIFNLGTKGTPPAFLVRNEDSPKARFIFPSGTQHVGAILAARANTQIAAAIIEGVSIYMIYFFLAPGRKKISMHVDGLTRYLCAGVLSVEPPISTGDQIEIGFVNHYFREIAAQNNLHESLA